VDSDVADLIARRSYPKALALPQAQLARQPQDARRRLKLADVLILAGRGKEAVGILSSLADAEAANGFAAKAIAVLKRIERIEPGRRDVEERTAPDSDLEDILTGKPRTATLTAATSCEVLELDNATLDGITQSHPRVLEVLSRFHEARAEDTIEAVIRNRP
jgi:hypothetical protein